MEENKYYTPEIEEFHVGFEYERMNGDKFEKSSINIYDMISNINGDENEIEEIHKKFRTVRVKCLDKEDIESFGLKLHTSTDDRYGFEYDIKEGNAIIGGFTDTQNEENIMLYETYFYVKNKSEFERLLKQVGLLKDGR